MHKTMTKIGMKLLILFLSWTQLMAGNSLDRGAFEKAKMQASEQGKLLFVDFYAPWCNPCQWMDENTFKDPEVIGQLQQHFITLRVNIDDMEGFEMKSRFDIRFLPTVLIFNQEGVMVERREETLGIKKMRSLLASVIDKKMEQPVVHKVNTSPSTAFTSGAAPVKVEKKEIVASGQYWVQLGAYSQETNAVRQSEELARLLQKEVSVQKVDNAGKKLFRVVAASFSSRDEAEKYREEIQQKHHLQAVVL